jgi:hypothetical protein
VTPSSDEYADEETARRKRRHNQRRKNNMTENQNSEMNRILAAGEFFRLPKPPDRDPLAGGSRGWMLDFDRELPPDDKFIIRAKRRGRARGVCFVDGGKYLAALRKLSSETK